MRTEHAVYRQSAFQQLVVKNLVEHVKQVNCAYSKQFAHVIPPEQTRESISMALDVASHNPEVPPFRTGVLQV